MVEHKVLITTSGVGSRLGELTDYTNKSLVRLGDKPSISHIIDNYPEKTDFVITLGYYGDHIKQYLQIAHPKKKFTFVKVDKYEGQGSSLAYSILQAKNKLQCPFIFHACDTITFSKVPDPDINWCASGHAEQEIVSQYRSLNVSSDFVSKINDKGCSNYDFVYIGVCGINDYDIFWKEAEKLCEKNSNNMQLSDCDIINLMLRSVKFKNVEIGGWCDMGNMDSLKKSRKLFKNSFNVLDKSDESIFLIDNHIIKFFHNSKVCQNRVKRSKHLNGLTPSVLESSDNFYKYQYTQGSLYADTANGFNFAEFLNWSKEKLWVKSAQDINKSCEQFYFNKTIKRLNKYFLDTNTVDCITSINGEDIPPVFEMLENIDKHWLCHGEAGQFHGDFILDNVIKTKDGYCLIDWRQDFAGDLKHGDIYYDLAKLNHNLILNHENIKNGYFTIEDQQDEITCDIMVNFKLLECRDIFQKFLIKNNFDVKKINVLTSLVWLNMAPLHEYPLNKFLFYFGKYNLYKHIQGEDYDFA